MSSFLLQILLIVFLLACSAFFSGSETALFSLSSVRVNRLRLERPRKGSTIARLLSDPRRLLTSILVANMFVNILSSTVSDTMLRGLMGNEGTVLSVLVMTFLILVIGEITPKTIAIRNAERVSLHVGPAIEFLSRVLYPFRVVLRLVTDRLILLFGRRLPGGETAYTEEELRTAVALGRREGVVGRDEEEMIEGVFRFADKRVWEVMRPRNDIVSFPLTVSFEEVARTVKAREYSRIPVYEADPDDIVGVLYVKDVLRSRQRDEAFRAEAVMRPVFFVPSSMRIDALFRQFRAKRTHLAIAVDEYGSVDGLVSLEDLLEEIVGEVVDKGDQPAWRRVDDRTVRAAGKMEIEDLNRIFSTDLEDPENVTVGGFLVSAMGHIPRRGETFSDGGLRFRILKASRNRVREILIRKMEGES